MIKQIIALTPAVLFIIMLASPIYNIIPPLGDLFQPVDGIYTHLDNGVHPKFDKIQDASLIDDVTVYRDEFGVPHIYAENSDDLFFAEGYIMTLDKLFEMDILRRFPSGRLAEFISALNLPENVATLDPQILAGVDSYFRIIGLPDVGKNFVEQVKSYGPDSIEYRMLYRYVDGVNCAMDQMLKEGNLPIGYALLDIRPQHWTDLDVGYIAALISFALGLKTKDLDYTSLVGTLGTYISENAEKYAGEGFNALFPESNGTLPYAIPIIPDNSTIYPNAASSPESSNEVQIISTNQALISTLQQLTEIDTFIHETLGLQIDKGTVQASNNWVVSGNRTESGLPILCGDPHLLIMQPSVFYEIHLVCNSPEPINCHGVTFPGAPIITIGFNDKIGWSLTNFASDSQVDYYYEVLNDDETQYFFNGSWHDLEIETQTIHVRKGEDVTLKIRRTIHGPIISDSTGLGALSMILDSSNPNEGNDESGETIPISMKWTSLQTVPNHNIFTAYYKLMKAQNLNDFEDAMKNWSYPVQNVVYADVDGNIGMFMPGLHPIRAINGTISAEYTGNLIQPGDGTGQEWVGYIPYEDIPKSINPEQDYLASANHRTIAYEDYSNYSVGQSWADNYRGRRINQILSTSWNITREDMIRAQADIYDVSAEGFLPPLLNTLNSFNQTTPLEGDLNLAFSELLTWNNSYGAYEMRKEWVAPTIFSQYLKFVEDYAWEDEWEAADATGSHYPSLQYLEYMVRENLSSVWFDNVSTVNTIETGSEIMMKAFIDAVYHISDNLGNLTDSRSKWIYGQNFKLLLPSILEVVDLVSGSDTGIPYDGSEFTVDAAASTGEFPAYVFGGPAYRQIVDFANMDEPLTVLPPGNAENPFSPHWDDQRYLFVNNQYKTVCRANRPDEFLGNLIESTVILEAI